MLNIPKNYPIFLRLNPFFILIIAFLVSLLWLWVFHVRYKAAEKRNKQFLTNFYNVNDSDANDHIAKALSFSKGNAVYYANQGLFFVRNVGRQFEKIVNDSLKITVSDKKKLQMAQEAFEKATELNPDDALFIHNLAWIRYLLGDTIAAMSNFNRTNELDPNIALYHISRGLIFEREGEIKKAVKEYLLAICLSPDIIDSDFFIHLKTCFPEKTDSIGKEAIKCLENKVKQTNNPIFKARLAKLYLSNKQYTKAEKLLTEVTKQLPNLNRPWYYLGVIEEMKNDTNSFKKSYQRSLLLDQADYLPNLRMAEYYYRFDPKASLAYYRNALRSWCMLYSDHYYKSVRIYDSKLLSNDVFPSGLLSYIKPAFDYNLYCQKISGIYAMTGKKKLAEYYNKLSIGIIPVTDILNNKTLNSNY